MHAEPLLALAKYQAILNFVLGVFNLVPGFPLDGGHIFRSILWGITGNFRRSSTIATVTGRAFGFLLIFAGVWLALAGNVFMVYGSRLSVGSWKVPQQVRTNCKLSRICWAGIRCPR